MAFPRPARAPFAAIVTAALLDWACASAPSPDHTAPVATPAASSCLVAAESIGPSRAVAVVFADAADAERARLADSLRTPVRFDCTGRAIPELATAWSADSSRTYWTLELGAWAQAGADDEPPAVRVATAWRTSPGAAATLELAGVQSMLPLDQRRLAIGFASAHPSIPMIFADATLGLPRGGTGPARLLATAPGGDLRDALDRGADVVVGRDPLLLDYAARRAGLTAVPLPWSRSYVLLVPPGQSLGDVIPPDTGAFRAGLARDAVRAEARPAAAPFWWDAAPGCQRPAPPVPSAPSSDVIGYERGDASARELAERLVALADTLGLTARGYPAEDFRAALRAGRERAYVVAVPAHAYVPCREIADWPSGAMSVGLVETRARAVIRQGTPPLAVDWDGTLHATDPSGPAPPSP